MLVVTVFSQLEIFWEKFDMEIYPCKIEYTIQVSLDPIAHVARPGH